MGQQCPYLGLQSDPYQLSLAPNPRHRCYRSGQAERVAAAHQRETCLTADYWRCPRVANRGREAQPPASQVRTAGSDLSARHPDLQSLSHKAARRRPLTCVEFMVLCLATCIVLAGCVVVYGLVHRLQVGPGMQAVAEVATAPVAMPEAAPPVVQLVRREAAPTAPPTVPPTVASPEAKEPAVAPGVPPTSIPEPTLALPPAVRPPAQSPPTRLTIDKIGLDIPVLSVGTTTIQQGGQSKVVWGDVPNAGAFHSTSAYPGNAGNTVINGHRDVQGSVFRHLDRVEVGDEIVLYVGEMPYTYRVAEILVVPETFASPAQRAENLRLIGFLPEERVTLVTCTPIGLATHRLLVIARPAD